MCDTAIISEYIVSNSYDDLPEEVVAAAETHIRDTLGVGLAGSQTEVGDIAVSHAETSNPGDTAAIIGHGTASTEGAAFANGVLSHVLEWDDTPVAPITPPILPHRSFRQYSPRLNSSMSQATICSRAT